MSKRKEKKNDAGADRITELPEDAMDLILRRVPLQDAVRTSALSRQWRNNWRNMTKIVVDESFHNYVQKKYSSLPYQHDFVRIVYDVVLNQYVARLSFQLYITEQGCPSEEVVGSWILSLSLNGVEQLVLVNKSKQAFYKLPSHFYSCEDLVSLHLRGFHFKPPSTFLGFLVLKRLHFEGNIFDEKPFQRFITSCLSLEQITLICSGSPKDIVIICSERLKYLCLKGKLKSVFINAQGLETLHVIPDSPMILNTKLQKVNSPTADALGNLRRMETLCFGRQTLKFLAGGGLPHKYPTDSLTNIEYDLLDFEDNDQISVAVRIIQNAPHLRYLKIKAYWRARYAVKRITGISLRDDITLGCLKTVRFYELRGIQPELDLVKSLLASSPSLEKMTIEAKPVAETDGVDTIPAELMRFSRVSPKAEIHYSKST